MVLYILIINEHKVLQKHLCLCVYWNDIIVLGWKFVGWLNNIETEYLVKNFLWSICILLHVLIPLLVWCCDSRHLVFNFMQLSMKQSASLKWSTKYLPFEGLFFQHADSQLWLLHNTFFIIILWFTKHFDLFKVLLRCTMCKDKSCQLLLNSFSKFYGCNVICSAHIKEAIIRLVVCELKNVALRPFELNGIWVWALLGQMNLGFRTGPLCLMFYY
jgi:hypothetical protein